MALSGTWGSLSLMDVVCCIFIVLLIYYISYVIYTLFFHPLSDYPGPKFAAVSHLPQITNELCGRQHIWIKALHDKYGEVVRIGPNDLVYCTPQVWKDIYGHKKKFEEQFSKDPQLYTPTPNGTGGLIVVENSQHGRVRRLISHAFSEQALRKQETLLHTYADHLIERFHKQAAKESPSNVIDIVRWYNYTTFDLIGDLSFGEPFYCLRDDKYHWWVSLMLDAVKVSTYLKILHFYPCLKPVGKLFIPKRLSERKDAMFRLSVEKVDRRLQVQMERPDFISYLLKHRDSENAMTREELDANASTFILAGSETTASMLSGCTYHLLQSPDIYRRLVSEIRGSFNDALDIQVSSVSKLSYLNAVISESMRIYPPVPAMLPRLVPKGGAMINGKYVPQDTSVSISIYSTFRSAANFALPDSFIPERWLDPKDIDVVDKRFEMDKKGAMLPFSTGPRNCIGQHLAHAELRLILTKLLWNFDLALCSGMDDWLNHKSYNLWDRPPLKVKVFPASAAGV